MTRLSVNVNKVALLRNSRGGNLPNLVQVAKDCEAFGAQGITVHPRPDERHIRYSDVAPLKEICTTEYNIEGYPSKNFLNLVRSVKPHQCTLVPDLPGVLTSDTGWNTLENLSFLQDVVASLHEYGIRVSLFLDPVDEMVHGAKATGAERIELYTGPYAHEFSLDSTAAVAPYRRAGELAHRIGLGVNAGHDLNLTNLRFFNTQIPALLEVSIGHALISDALYFGLQNTIQMYLRELRPL